MSKKMKIKKPGWIEEFKTFAIKGNAMALAVGTIIGASFTSITKSLTDHMIMPIVNMFFGGVDFSKMMIALPRMPWVKPVPLLDEAGAQVIINGELQWVENYLRYGDFISAVINFFIIALVVFFLVKFINKLTEIGKKKEEAPAEVAPAPEPEPTKEELLLAEIRDILKDK